MRFLLSRLSSLGDVVCTLPAAVSLKTAFPDCSVTWVVSPKFSSVVRCCSAVDRVVGAPKGLSKFPELNEPFDCALDLQGLFKSAWPVHLAKAPKKLGYHWQREGSNLFSQRVLPDPTSFHIVDQYIDVARAAGGAMDFASFAFAPSDSSLSDMRTRLVSEGLKKFIVLNPGAAWASKRWPEEHCVKFIDNVNLPVVLIGGSDPEELEIANRISKACMLARKPFIWTGKTTLEELIALLSECALHVGGDTGSTHLAAALGKPCIGLYSITNPRRSCPYGQIQNCFYEPFGLIFIDPEEVAAKARELAA